jgi:FtsZ-binding cell division protein ZapB
MDTQTQMTNQQHQANGHDSAAPTFALAATEAGIALSHYDAACSALAAALAVDEVQDIRAKAEAMRAYAKQAKNRQMEMDAAEIRIRAERRMGEMMAAQGATVGKATGQLRRGLESNPREPTDPPTLTEAGIDKNLAHRARTYAAVPKEQFEALLSKKRRRDNARVVLDPEFQAEAAAAARDLEIERDERIALSGGGELAAENEQLQRQVALLDRRIAALQEENSSLKFRENMWRERAVAAGWRKVQADA